jgi:5-methylthioadenosine/S-adenosylhomocysteine deaminase
MRARRYRAAWVLPIDHAPVAKGAVLLDDAGRILAVGPESSVPDPPGTTTSDAGQAALLPGLVNAHTHLELTGFAGRVEDDDFPSWIRKLIALKADRSAADFLVAAKEGIRDCWRAGITTLADTGASGSVIEALRELGGSGIAYHEVFGPHPDQAKSHFDAFVARLDELSRFTGSRIRLGVSPHAPYSVSGSLYRLVADLAADRSYPIAVHIAESAAESELLGSASGGFAAAWKARGIPLPDTPGISPIAWLDSNQVLGPDTLCIHAVRAGLADLDLVRDRNAAIAHCPRSNRRHRHGSAPLEAMLQRGLRVGLGTDSVASVSPLDLLAEAEAARPLASLDAGRALRLCTLEAARALGLDSEIGSLTPGKWGDLAIFDLPEGVDEARMADTLMSRGTRALAATYLAGREVWRKTP